MECVKPYPEVIYLPTGTAFWPSTLTQRIFLYVNSSSSDFYNTKHNRLKNIVKASGQRFRIFSLLPCSTWVANKHLHICPSRAKKSCEYLPYSYDGHGISIYSYLWDSLVSCSNNWIPICYDTIFHHQIQKINLIKYGKRRPLYSDKRVDE